MNLTSTDTTMPSKTVYESLAFIGNLIEPLSEKRSEKSVQHALEDKSARLLLVGSGKVCIKPGLNNKPSLHNGAQGPEALFQLSEILALGLSLDETVLLGHTPSGPILATPFVEADIPVDAGFDIVDLRSTYMDDMLPADIVGALAQAAAILSWNRSHRFCGRCGCANEMHAGGYKRVCSSCRSEHFPRTDPVAIMLVAKGENCLLGRSPRFAPGMYSCLAGFIEPGETIEAAVRRETFEESGVRVGEVKYMSSQPWPFPYSLMIGCIGEALTDEIHADANELEDCRWFTRAEVRQMLEGTHPEGLRAATKGAIARQLIAVWAHA